MRLPDRLARRLAHLLQQPVHRVFRPSQLIDLEVRVEAVNLFNVVNLGNPDAEIGVADSGQGHNVDGHAFQGGLRRLIDGRADTYLREIDAMLDDPE